MKIEILPVPGLPEIDEGADLGAMIAAHAALRDGDVVVVAQKAVSKAEGRVVSVDPARRAEERAAWIEREAASVVARRGDLVVARTRHGFVCAAAGVDASNVPPDRLALLPLDPDASATRIRRSILQASGRTVGVVVTDTFGRPWRAGQTNVAIGLSGVEAVRDHRGEKDMHGNLLEVTEIAVADEIAGAAELVMGKSDGICAAIVRGAGAGGDDRARRLVRDAGEDLFPTGALEAVGARRSVRRFDGRPVPEEIVRRAVQAAITAPAPHGSRVPRPFRFVWLRSDGAREGFLAAMERAWREDMAAADTPPGAVERRLARSRALLGEAPVLLACFVTLAGADRYVDDRRARAERDMFVAAAGAAVQSLMIALAAQGAGSCWVSSSIFCPHDAAEALGLDAQWQAAGCVAAGYPESPAGSRPPAEPGAAFDVR